MRQVLIFLISLCVFISCKKAPEQKEENGNIEGIIKDESGQPIADALIGISCVSIYSKFSPSSVHSGSDGKYSFTGLPINSSQAIDEYSLAVSKQLYIAKTQIVKITNNSTSKLDFTLSQPAPYFTVSDSLIDAPKSAGSFDITITSNAKWTVKNSALWLTCLKKNGEGNDVVGFTFSQNPDVTNRIDTVDFVCGTIKRSVVVMQPMPILLLSYELEPYAAMPDSYYGAVLLRFNKPVTVTMFKGANEVIYFENHKVVRLGLLMKKGSTYVFTIAVTDGKGNSFQKDVIITV